MLSFYQWLVEMPITTWGKIGDWESEKPKFGWDDPSRGILTSEKGFTKILDAWKKSPVDFDLYFVRKSGAKKYLEVGEVTPEWLKENLDIDFTPNPTSISVFFTQNIGDEKIPMTAWMIAHRLGHSLGTARRKFIFEKPEYGTYPYFEKEVEKDFSNILFYVYGYSGDRYGEKFRYLNDLMKAVGTFRSARLETLARFGEFAHELFAQVIIAGKVTFKELPRQIGKWYAWGKPQYKKSSKIHDDTIALKEYNIQLQQMAHKYTEIITTILTNAVGKVFVM